MRTRLIIITAPSGAGKTTLCQKLLVEFPELKLSISSTTRLPRGNEKHGVEYFFLTREEFQQEIELGGFAEWANVHEHYYGTAKQTLLDSSQNGKTVLLDIDFQGADSLHQHYPDQCLRIFISPPSLEELESRLRRRGTESELSIQKRLFNAKTEMDQKNRFDFVVINDSLPDAYLQLSEIVRNFLKKDGHD